MASFESAKVGHSYTVDPLKSRWRLLSSQNKLHDLKMANPLRQPDVEALRIAVQQGHAEIVAFWTHDCQTKLPVAVAK